MIKAPYGVKTQAINIFQPSQMLPCASCELKAKTWMHDPGFSMKGRLFQADPTGMG
jgi:hypothetical protein